MPDYHRMKKIAYFFSVLFHPLLLPTYAFAIIVFTNPYMFGNYPVDMKWMIVLRVFINTFIFPGICILLLKQLGYVKSLNMEDKQERIIPYICCMTFYFWTFMVYRKSEEPIILNTTLLGSCVTLAGVFVINIFRKISIHTAGMGCLIGLMLGNTLFSTYNMIGVFLLTCLIAGLVGTSRLLLNAHENKEIYLGYFVGFIAQMMAFRFM